MRFSKKLLASSVVSGMALAAGAVTSFGSSIGTVEMQPSGTAGQTIGDVTTPVVTAIGSAAGTSLDGYTYSNWAIIAQDNTGSIELFGHFPTGDAYVPAVGDTVTASGTYSPFDQIPELASLTAISKTGSAGVPAPIAVTASQLTGQSSVPSSVSGYLVTLQNVMFPTGSGNFPTHANGTYTVTDASGNNPVTVFQWASSYSAAGAFGGTAVPTGLVNITGIVDYFGTGSNGLEFIPFAISPASVPAPSALWSVAGLVGACCLIKWVRSNARNGLQLIGGSVA